MKEISQQDFLEKYATQVDGVIRDNRITYTTDKISVYNAHRYYVDTKDIYVFVLKMLDPKLQKKPKYMFCAKIKKEGISFKICGDFAQGYYLTLLDKYNKDLQRSYGSMYYRLRKDSAYRPSKTK